MDTTEKYKNDIQRISGYYGLEAQLDKTVEELGELLQAIEKYKIAYVPWLDRKPRSVENFVLADMSLTEELADAQIMISQIAYLTANAGSMELMISNKLCRQLDRIEAEQAEGDVSNGQ